MSDRRLQPGDSEMIAAFLDGRLPESERRQFMERLDRDEALYEVFVETVRYRDTVGGGASVVAHPAAGLRRDWIIPASVAAILALAVALSLLLREGGLFGDSSFAVALVERGALGESLDDDWIQQGWRVTRGVSQLGSEVDSAFRVGVHTIDLEVALRLGRAADAEELLPMIDRALGGIELSDQLQLSYAEIGERLEEGLSPEQALELAAAVEPQAEAFLDLDFGYSFGRWAEAGKLAARSGNRDLLRSGAFLTALRAIRQHEWTEDVNQRLELIGAALADGESELDLAELGQAFTAIINES